MDVKDGRVVKGIKFQGLRDAGDPVERAFEYERQGADELVLLDVSATPEGRRTALDTVAKVRAKLSIPLTVGGGVKKAQDAANLLEAGADKVAMNTAAIADPSLIERLAERFGVQCTILAVDAKQKSENKWIAVVRSGVVDTEIDVIEWCKLAVSKGVGEILLTSWDRDGTRSGYDLELVKAVSSAVNVPVIASGGVDNPEQMLEGLDAGADAVLAASIFHDGDYKVKDLKDYLIKHNVEIRR